MKAFRLFSLLTVALLCVVSLVFASPPNSFVSIIEPIALAISAPLFAIWAALIIRALLMASVRPDLPASALFEFPAPLTGSPQPTAGQA